MNENILKIIDLFKKKQFDDALKLCDEVKDNSVEHIIYNLKGSIYHKKNNAELSKKNLLKSIEIKPDYVEAYKNLYLVSLENKNYNDAIKHIKELINLENNNNPISSYQLALVYEMKGSFINAIENYKISEKLGFKDKKTLFNNLGNVYLHNKDIIKAEHCFLKSLEFDNSNITVLNNLFNFYIKIRKHKKAEEVYNKIYNIDKNSNSLQLNKVELLILHKKFDEAENILKSIINNDKNFVVYLKLATIYRRSKKNELYEKLIKECLKLFPNEPYIKFLNGWSQIEKGNFDEGWKNYDFRKTRLNEKYSEISEWKGESLKEKNILVYNEQGIGDAIQFSQYLLPLSVQSKEINFIVSDKLIPFFKKKVNNINIYTKSEIVGKNFDFKISLGSLIQHFYKKNLSNFDNLIYQNNSKIKEWSKKLDYSKLNVGIVWSGDFFGPNEPYRSIPLILFDNILKLNANFYSLQNDVREEDKLYLKKSKIVDYGNYNLEDIAAIIHNLDLIISVDTSLLHISYFQKKETWGLLSLNSDFRWGKLYELNPHENLKFYKQSEFDNWSPVLTQIKINLNKKIENFKR